MPPEKDALMALVQNIHDNQMALAKTLNDHIKIEPKEWAQVLSELIEKSFPDGDPEGHRRFHEASIKRAEDSAAFWGDMRHALSKWGLIGFALWALKALYDNAIAAIAAAAHLK